MSKILIIDDEKNIRRSLEMILTDEGYDIVLAECGNEALIVLEKDPPDLILLDLLMPEKDGLQVLSEIKNTLPDLTVIMMSGHGSIGHAVQAVKSGAYDFIEKPLTKEKVLIVVQNALEQRSLRRENRSLRQALDKKIKMIGESPLLESVRHNIAKIAPTSARVLILGESGTGKELIARGVHAASPRSKERFVAINCAAIPDNLLESELFGYEKGAFTGAAERRRGRFELADGGTLFLDEIGEIDPNTQVKILRVLEERKFERVGGQDTVDVDVRLIAATNRDLKKLVEEGRFREDLFYRLYVMVIHLPPLRERPGDVPLLVQQFLTTLAKENNKAISGITPEAMELLAAHPWPGNVRELRNAMERMVVLCRGDKLSVRDIPAQLKAALPHRPAATAGAELSLQDAEKRMIADALKHHAGNRTKAAAQLGISRRTLHRKLNEYGLREKDADNTPPGD